MWPNWWSIGKLIPDAKPGFKEAMLWAMIDEGYRGGAWIIKHDILCFPCWSEFAPRWICVRRDAQAVAQSLQDFYQPGPERAHFAIKRIPLYEELLDHLVALGGKPIWMADLIQGDLHGLHDAMQYCGLEMNAERVQALIDPTLEHWR